MRRSRSHSLTLILAARALGHIEDLSTQWVRVFFTTSSIF